MGKNLINTNIQSLRLLKEAGVTDNLNEFPINRFNIKESFKNEDIENNSQTMNLKTEQQLLKIQDLKELQRFINNFKGCALYKEANNVVFSDGNPNSKIMLIGEAPGHDEDIEGKPFVGRSGKLLDKMLEAIELNREKVYIANIIPWRPPSNRRPTDEEIEICLPFIKKHIELIKPKVLMLLGSTATFALLKNTEGITKIRGKWVNLNLNSISVPTLPTFHPAFLLRQPAQKKHVWEDLKSLKNKVSN